MPAEYEPNRKRNKRGLKAPCEFTEWSETAQKDVTLYPACGCSQECGKCGWNPVVAARRLRKQSRKRKRSYVLAANQSPTASWGLPPWRASWDE